MGMFDWYQPAATLTCPVCGESLTGWQGKGGPNALFVWSEGTARPVNQTVDEECRWSPAELAEGNWRLPPAFEIHTCDDSDHWISAHCTTVNDVWATTTIVDVRELGARDPLWRSGS